MREKIIANATKDNKFWFIQIEGTELATQAKTLDTIEPMARDLYAFIKEIPADSFDVVVKTVYDEMEEIAELAQLKEKADTARKEYALSQEKAVQKLSASLNLKEIGKLLHLSNQRVSQIAKKYKAHQ